VKRLIINADDFGLTDGVNRGVRDCCVAGGATSATLMAVGGSWSDAVNIARETLQKLQTPISTGCHVVLMDGVPSLSHDAVRSLLRNTEGGTAFYSSFSSFGRRAMLGRFDAGEIRAEVASQIEKLQRAGLTLTHADSHKHAHLFPNVIGGFVRALKDCGVPAIRNPFFAFRFPNVHQVRERPRLMRRFVQIPLLRPFARRFQSEVRAAGLRTPDGCIGVYAPTFQSYEQMSHVLKALPEGTWELVCHPGYVDKSLDQINTSLRSSREAELQMLCSERFRQMLRNGNIELCSYLDL
jgi:predicted glycoside hydrolase/deacetylase ChbG (UPF0249 family)